MLRHSGIVSPRLAFDNALKAFNVKMEIELLSNPSEIAAPILMKKLTDIYFTSVTQMAESTFSLSPRQMALWQSQMEDHTSDWLRVVPISGLGQTTIGDIYGDHAVSCAGIVGIKHRHNVVRNTLVDICYRSGISSVGGERNKSLLPADVLLYSWDVRRDVLAEATQRKRVKYEAKCADIRYDFLPFLFSSFGELEKDAVTLLKRIQKFSKAQDIGARAAVHIFNRISFSIAKAFRDDVGLSMLLVDFKNAFNLVDREVMLREVHLRCPTMSRWVEFCYSNPARLYYEEHTLWSCQGVQQGDPLGLLLFSLVLHPLICKIRDSFSLSLHAWYLDDDTIVGDTMVVRKVLELIMKDGPGCGLHLNIDKTKVFWPKEDPRSRLAGIPLFSVSKPCSACSRVFDGDIYGDRIVSCAGIIGIKHRHNIVCDTLVGHMLSFSGFQLGLDVCVDLTGSSPLTQTGMVDFVSGRAVIDVAQRKHGKYMAKRAAIGYGFLPFSFSSLGELEACAVTLLKRIRKFFITQDIGAHAVVHIFNRISFAVAKGVWAQITGMADFVHGRAMIDAAQRKHGKYMAKCAYIGYGFLPFSFSSLGELEAGAVTLLKRIRKFSMAQDIWARAAIHIFNMISFAIAKGVRAQIVSRLPSNLL
ncbi:putative reverse transcriptase domain-containing protein [Tanacetum coccineum]|uniref:Reverse transcriptase domain-containing protein n=1 Tax=Tanacetum coccineum TaxID=301880 RepID=A0ABQ5FZ28_9ASTR